MLAKMKEQLHLRVVKIIIISCIFVVVEKFEKPFNGP